MAEYCSFSLYLMKKATEAIIDHVGKSSPRCICNFRIYRTIFPPLKMLKTEKSLIGQKCFMKKTKCENSTAPGPKWPVKIPPFLFAIKVWLRARVCLCQHVGGILFSRYMLHSSTFPLLGIVKTQWGPVISWLVKQNEGFSTKVHLVVGK